MPLSAAMWGASVIFFAKASCTHAIMPFNLPTFHDSLPTTGVGAFCWVLTCVMQHGARRGTLSTA